MIPGRTRIPGDGRSAFRQHAVSREGPESIANILIAGWMGKKDGCGFMAGNPRTAQHRLRRFADALQLDQIALHVPHAALTPRAEAAVFCHARVNPIRGQ